MENNRTTAIIVVIKGIIMILIGVIHTIAIFFETQDALRSMNKYWAVNYAIWFGLTGMFWLFIGVMDILSYSGLKKRTKYAWRTAFVSGIFPVVLVPIALCLFEKFQPSTIFPVIILFLGAVSLIVLLIKRKKFTSSFS